MRKLLIGLIFTGLAAAAAAQDGHLGAGHYSATIKALTCASCSPKFEEAIKSVPGIAGAMVYSEQRQVIFVLKKGAAVDIAALQKKLTEVAARMGMSADYSLTAIQRMKAG